MANKKFGSFASPWPKLYSSMDTQPTHAANAGASLFSLDPLHPSLAKAMNELKAELASEIAAADARFEAGGYGSGVLHSSMDITLHRFLIGDNLHVAKTAATVRRSLKWREEVGADKARDAQQRQAFAAAGLPYPFDTARDVKTCNVYTSTSGAISYKEMQELPGAPRAEDHPHYDVGYGYYQFGTRRWHFWDEKRGSPIAVRCLGLTDPSILIAEGRPEKYYEFLMHYSEMMQLSMEMMSLEQKRLVRFHVVVDLQGLGVRHLNRKALGVFKAIADIMSSHYPEVIHQMVLINAPWIFGAVFNLMKRWIPRETQEKISVHGDSYAEGLASLNMPIEKWPVLLGGEVPTAKHLVLPRSFDPTASVAAGAADRAGSGGEIVESVSIAAGASEEFEVPIVPGATCEWTLEVQGYDVDVSATFATTETEGGDDDAGAGAGGAVVFEKTRLAAGSGAEEGVLRGSWTNKSATADGVLKLTFDNSYSWMRSKTVKCTLRFEKEEEEEETGAAAGAAAKAAEE